MSSDTLAERLEAELGADCLLRDGDTLAAMSASWRDNWKSEPRLAVLPRSTSEVQLLMHACHDFGCSVVVQGGNTGVTGAGICRADELDVLVSLKRMNKIRSLDIEDGMLVAEAGCILSDIQDAASRAGAFFPLSLGAQGSCTIGGNIATNAGGINALRYGTTRRLVAGLEVVLPDGRLWNGLRCLRKDNAGYDLKQLFIGSEGTLGIVTAAALILSSKPRVSATAMVGIETPRKALAWLRRLRDAFDQSLVACELVERSCIDAVTRHRPVATDPFATSYPWYVLCELSSPDPETNLETRLSSCFAAAFETDEVLDGVIATSLQQSQKLWELREFIPEAHRKEGVSFKHDISVPVSKIPHFLVEAENALSTRFPGIRQFAFGHMGDGNIHYNSLQATGESAELWSSRLSDVNRIVHDIALRLGGSISAEHGIGQLRREELPRYKPAVELEMMKAVKDAIDPRGLMNPAKLFRS